MKILVDKKYVKEIPFIVAKKEDASKKPLVIVSHGFTRSKEDFISNGYLRSLAEQGYYAVAIDNRLHGDRTGPDFKTAVMNQFGKVDLITLRNAMKETAEDVIVLLDALTQLEEVDGDRIAMLGVSMGGFITHRTIVTDHRIKVGVPIISSPFWDDIPGDVSTQMDDKNHNELIQISENYQPAKYMDQYAPTALLMQVGDIDMHYDLDKLQGLYQDLEQYYSAFPEKLDFIIYSDTKHEFKPEMWERALQWIKKWI